MNMNKTNAIIHMKLIHLKIKTITINTFILNQPATQNTTLISAKPIRYTTIKGY